MSASTLLVLLLLIGLPLAMMLMHRGGAGGMGGCGMGSGGHRHDGHAHQGQAHDRHGEVGHTANDRPTSGQVDLSKNTPNPAASQETESRHRGGHSCC